MMQKVSTTNILPQGHMLDCNQSRKLTSKQSNLTTKSSQLMQTFSSHQQQKMPMKTLSQLLTKWSSISLNCLMPAKILQTNRLQTNRLQTNRLQTNRLLTNRLLTNNQKRRRRISQKNKNKNQTQTRSVKTRLNLRSISSQPSLTMIQTKYKIQGRTLCKLHSPWFLEGLCRDKCFLGQNRSAAK